jgi:hypothetical protein
VADSFLQRWAQCLAVLAAIGGGGAGGATVDPDGGPDLAADVDEARRLRARLEGAGPLERIGLVSSWAVSTVDAERLAIARALAAPLEAVGVRSALAHLAADADPAVAAAARAALSGRTGVGSRDP